MWSCPVSVDPRQFADCWFLTGPTASGKTAVGLALARRIEAEIVSLDSMAVYRGMDIGTAKPTAAEQYVVPHHLIDVLDPGEECSVARYLELAARAVREIRARGREVLFVGGSPLYLKGLLRGIFRGPPADWDLRRRLEEEAGSVGVSGLHRRLAEVDPAAAQRLHENDLRRIVRALEVYERTGRPISQWQQQDTAATAAPRRRAFRLCWPRAPLHIRVEARVEQMFAAGLVDEVRGLLDRGVRFGRTARQAVGYQEVFDLLAGECDLPTAIERVKVRTRRYVRHQETWFRRLTECRPVEIAEPLDAAATAELIADLAMGPL